MSDSESDAELQQLVAVPGVYKEFEKPRPSINNKPVLLSTLEHLRNRLPWIERLDIVTPPALPLKGTGLDNEAEKIDPNDDFKREAFFYRVAQAAVLKAIPQLHDLGVSTRRPNDYFAEMIKSDAHMIRVREHIVVNKKRVELREKARQLRDARKFGKQTQKEVLESRRIEKKKHMEALKAAKKRPGGKEQVQFLEEFLITDSKKSGTQSKGKEQTASFHRPKDVANRRKINHKRAYKNQTYGHGGQKKRSKRNDSESIRSGGRDIRVLSHKTSAERVNKLQKAMFKSKRINTKKQKSKLKRMR